MCFLLCFGPANLRRPNPFWAAYSFYSLKGVAWCETWYYVCTSTHLWFLFLRHFYCIVTSIKTKLVSSLKKMDNWLWSSFQGHEGQISTNYWHEKSKWKHDDDDLGDCSLYHWTMESFNTTNIFNELWRFKMFIMMSRRALLLQLFDEFELLATALYRT